jgi:cephalosporin hydroxylase
MGRWITGTRKAMRHALERWYESRRSYIYPNQQHIRDEFHRVYYGPLRWPPAFWLGTEILKCPFDLWMYQEILFERQPDLIIETGTAHGGSALFLAGICDLLKHGQVVSVDIQPATKLPEHSRITWLRGDSVSPEVLRAVTDLRSRVDTAMVILDSNHEFNHVFREMGAYAPLVSVGQYLVVEDTNVNGHPVYESFGPGPWEAVEYFLANGGGDFRIDHSRERFLISFNPSGYLLRRK